MSNFGPQKDCLPVARKDDLRILVADLADDDLVEEPAGSCAGAVMADPDLGDLLEGYRFDREFVDLQGKGTRGMLTRSMQISRE